MHFKDKIISILKVIGIVLLSFLAIFLGSGILNIFKGRNTKDEAKKSIDNVKDTLNTASDTLKESSQTLEDMKETISEAKEEKEKIANASSQSRQEEAIKAGFKKVI
jgi:F0F1-type ATP synthase membrane subunit b/b'